jgi:predicted amidohydrolase YtcJ
MPGFNDAHVHLASAGREKLTIDLVAVKSLFQMQERIATAAKAAHPGSWLRGRGWDHTLWPSKQLPTRQDLDAVTGGHPAIFTRVDGHIAIANSQALRLAGITAKTSDPSGGKIDRDAGGEPTGIVRETAVDLVYSKVPAPSRQERWHALDLAMRDAIAHGITSVQDYSTWDDFLVFEEMEREHKLPIRISEWLTFSDPLQVLESSALTTLPTILCSTPGCLKVSWMDHSAHAPPRSSSRIRTIPATPAFRNSIKSRSIA